jgi:hypothetical protein
METTTIKRLFCRLNQFLMIYKTYFTFFHPFPVIPFTPLIEIIIYIIMDLHFRAVSYFLKYGVGGLRKECGCRRKGTTDAAWQYFYFQIS